MNALMNAVREALSRAGLWKDGAVLLCALSGGCDSTALMHAMCRLRAEKRIAVHAVHVQHGLRGEESLADEAFVREMCRRLDAPLTVANAGLTGDMHSPGIETLARERRRVIFEQELTRLNADALLTAHHQDDQAETVLMHLLRGSGMNGLCGMKKLAPFGGGLLIRPFLNVPKAALRTALENESLSFREDASNQETLTPRNTLRLQLIPQLEKLFPCAGEHLAHTAELLAGEEAYLAEQADQLFERCFYHKDSLFMLAVQPLCEAPEALRRRALRRWFLEGMTAAEKLPDERALSREDTLALSALVHKKPGSKLNLPCGLTAAREKHWLHLVRQSGAPLQKAAAIVRPLEAGQTHYALPHLSLQAQPAFMLPHSADSAIIPQELLAGGLVFRLMQPGDQIQPFGAPGHKPLRRYLTDCKADPYLRPVWPVLCFGSEVLWIPGLCASERLRAERISPDDIQLTLSGKTPFPFKLPKE